MTETFITLLAAHLLADFPLQTDSMVAKKKEIKTLLCHVSVLAGVTALLIGNLSLAGIGIVLATFLSHLVMDAVKAHKMNDDAKSFSVDQVFHFGVIVLLAWLCPSVVENGLWQSVLADHLPWFYVVMTLVSGVILVVPAGGILIGKLTEPIRQEIKENPIVLLPTAGQKSTAPADGTQNEDYLVEGLKNGGKYIGWLERFLTLMLILIGQPTGIGFLIAAKSILRFGEIKEAKHRKLAEYIIIGTFLSFGWALTIAVFTKEGFNHWHPRTDEPIEKIQVFFDDSAKAPASQQIPYPAPAPTPAPATTIQLP